MFALPLTWYIIFCYVPMHGLQLAFKDFNPLLGISGSPWRGFTHFERFFSSHLWRTVVWNTLSLNLYQLIFGFPIPIILAIIINELPGRRFKKTLQNVTYVPNFISVVVMCGMLILFLSPRTGIVNLLLGAFGISPLPFLESSRFFRGTYVASEVWQYSGWSSIIYIAALSGIDPALYEAAAIDGAGRLRKILSVSIPGILPTIVVLLLLRIGQMMSIGFEKVFLLQNDLNMSTSEVISTLVFKQGILQGRFEYATAVGLMNSIINLTLIVAANQLCKRRLGNSLW